MSTFSEMALQMHRAIWFPVHAALGLEQPGIVLPREYGPSLSATDPLIEDLERPSKLDRSPERNTVRS